jgi:hypothetical protein
MSILMSGEDCRSCRWSYDDGRRLGYLKCALRPGYVKPRDYCTNDYERRESNDSTNVPEVPEGL